MTTKRNSWGEIKVIIKCRCANLGPTARPRSPGSTKVIVLWRERGWRNIQGTEGKKKKVAQMPSPGHLNESGS